MNSADVKNIINNLTTNLIGRWDFYRHAAFLKKQGWTEEKYQDYNDPDRNLRASRIKDYYHGYPHVVVFTTSQGDPWTRYPSWVQAYSAIQEWCHLNCEGKFCSSIHRVIREPSTDNEWELNDIGGNDALFFAFKNGNDTFMFKLKWGGQ